MTSTSLAGAVTLRERAHPEALVGVLLRVIRVFRPSDGWLAVGLLVLNLLVVVLSVEQANWVPTPDLKFLIILGMAAGLFLSRVPVWSVLVLPVGVALGLLTIVWQLTSFEGKGVGVASADELWARLDLWLEAARTGTISIDTVPFAFGIMCATWLAGYLAGWAFFRWGNFWGVFVLGGAGLMSNLTYLPPNASVYLGMYLFTAVLLVARVQSVRRRAEWRRRNVTFDGHLGILSISDSFFLAIPVIILAFWVIPVGPKYGPANEVYEFMRAPFMSWEDDFNRLFAGLPARKALGYRLWGDVMAFQGTINPGRAQVLWVESPVPMYWKARSYGTYTAKGWISDKTIFKPVGWKPSFISPKPDLARFEVSYSVTPLYRSRTLFGAGNVVGVDRNTMIETYDSPTYTLDFTDPAAARNLPPKVAQAASDLQDALRLGGAIASEGALAARLPENFRLVEVSRKQGIVQKAVLAEVLPPQADVLSVRSEGREIKARDTYEITSSVSRARSGELRNAGTDYPVWALEKYTQLPDDLPRRVRNLAEQLTADADNPYDKALAIKQYLSTFPYTLQVDPPPFDADGVDHFLFTLRRGYSEYFASAMTVMLRSVGIPARLVTGYTTGDKVVDEDIYVVLDSNSHGWLEVYMPRYGWIPFEATPGNAFPVPVPPEASARRSAAISKVSGDLDETCDDEIDECDEESLSSDDGGILPGALGFGGKYSQFVPWLLGALAVTALASVVGRGLWRRYMVPSENPETTYRNMALLGSLAAVGPLPYQTPFQYRQRLAEALPNHREPVSVIINHYVRSFYGKKDLDDVQRQQLTEAWLRLRLPLLLHSLRRRNP